MAIYEMAVREIANLVKSFCGGEGNSRRLDGIAERAAIDAGVDG
ncbi:MAG TPA: hypothetical protein VKY65_13410 [Alphaproteobacteria bacterium]|nr:hypothetical protein [Alphaproteobacteria bacterium]